MPARNRPATTSIAWHRISSAPGWAGSFGCQGALLSRQHLIEPLFRYDPSTATCRTAPAGNSGVGGPSVVDGYLLARRDLAEDFEPKAQTADRSVLIVLVVHDQRAVWLATVIHVPERGRGLQTSFSEFHTVVGTVCRVIHDLALDRPDVLAGGEQLQSEDPQAMRRRANANAFFRVFHRVTLSGRQQTVNGRHRGDIEDLPTPRPTSPVD